MHLPADFPLQKSSAPEYIQKMATIDPFMRPFIRVPLSFSPGALYSRKVTLDGEEVSLQIQDTPCVALQVTYGGAEEAAVFPSQLDVMNRTCGWKHRLHEVVFALV